MQVNSQNTVMAPSPLVAKNIQPATNDQALFKKALSKASLTNAGTINIQWGDTLSQLAKTHHTTVANLVQLNHINNPDLIYAGNQLKLSPSNTNGDRSISKATNVANNTVTTNTDFSNLAPDEKSARSYIVQHESGGSYTARNGKYIGKYQLDSSYLNGDFSPSNQEKVAQKYVKARYGSWVNAMAHWKIHSWY